MEHPPSIVDHSGVGRPSNRPSRATTAAAPTDSTAPSLWTGHGCTPPWRTRPGVADAGGDGRQTPTFGPKGTSTVELAPESLPTRLLGTCDKIALDLFGLLRRELPALALWTPSRRHVLDTLRHGIVCALTLGPGQKPLSAQDTAILIGDVEAWVARGIPLEPVLAAFEIAGAFLMRQAWAQADVSDRHVLVAMSEWIDTTVKVLQQQAIYAHLRASRPEAAMQRHRGQLAQALLRGWPTAVSLAVAAGVELRDSYLVVAVRIDDGVPADLCGALPDGTVGCSVADLCVYLIPAAEDEVAGIRDHAESLVGGLHRPAGTVHVGYAWRPTREQVPDAFAEARTVVDLLTATDHQVAGALDDVLLEMALFTSPFTGRHLRDLVEPLHDGPDLPQTLTVLYANDLDRGRTAEQLHLHRTTLDYRLGRIRELTGLDPVSTRGVQLLASALTASRMAGNATSDLEKEATGPQVRRP